MLILTSPAKTLDLDPDWDEGYTHPEFLKEANELVSTLKSYTVKKLSDLLGVSEKLATLNHDRFQEWNKKHVEENSKPAINTYNGDVYREIHDDSYSNSQKEYLQHSLRIITGLYGLLKPYDLIQAYRLEMKTKVKTKKGNDLYDFWGDKLTVSLNNDIKHNNHKLLISLASNEYEKVVDLSKVECKVLDVVFLQKRDGVLKNIGILSKKARGLMIDYCVMHEVENIERLKAFDIEGYRFHEETASSLVFVK